MYFVCIWFATATWASFKHDPSIGASDLPGPPAREREGPRVGLT